MTKVFFSKINQALCTFFTLQNFDAVLTDPMVPTGALIARKLGELFVCLTVLGHPTCVVNLVLLGNPPFPGLPIVNLLRGIPCMLDMKSAGCPSPPSYVPRFFTGYTDKMSFKERTINTLVRLFLLLYVHEKGNLSNWCHYIYL